MDKYYSPEQIAEILLVQPRTVREWLRNGEIEGGKVSNQWRITHESLQKFKAAKNIDNNRFTVLEVAKIANVDEQTVLSWLNNGKLEGQKLGDNWAITKEKLQKAFNADFMMFQFDDYGIPHENSLLEVLYPEKYAIEQRRRYVSELDCYIEECGGILERRFPYPYAASDIVHRHPDGSPDICGNDPEAHCGFYWGKAKEEQAKLDRLMDMLKVKHGVPDDYIEEIKRTFENLNLLKIGQLTWDVCPREVIDEE